ncbi:PsbP domain-containing protein 2 [Abeliophyllum distichum]|uniref:PsbP domain-containing protein 2 n=1 Tax=Abeliophyllum distichum TaxID=126358 RepID=A0ABD1SDI1_9LAMI
MIDLLENMYFAQYNTSPFITFIVATSPLNEFRPWPLNCWSFNNILIPKKGFTLFIPSSWIKVEKAGATVLFEDANKKSNNVGVVVNPTRISSLGEYGTPQFVADKLIQAERRKESTKEAEVIAFSERSGHGGLQVYEFEYKVDSTRGGLKRVFSAAFVASKKLYLLNIAHSDGLDDPLDMERRMFLEQILHSFDAVPAT